MFKTPLLLLTSLIALTACSSGYLAWTAAGLDVYVQRWDGSAWGELAGSASGTGISGTGDQVSMTAAL